MSLQRHGEAVRRYDAPTDGGDSYEDDHGHVDDDGIDNDIYHHYDGEDGGDDDDAEGEGDNDGPLYVDVKNYEHDMYVEWYREGEGAHSCPAGAHR